MTDNVSYGHKLGKPECGPEALRLAILWCDNVAMGKQRHFIKAWRKHRDLTQVQLAERIGMDRSYLSQIESGKRRYDQPFLEAAAEVLRCEPADLIMRDPSDPDGLWSIYDQLGKVERVQLVEMAKVIKRTASGG